MLDVLGINVRRGDRIIDQWGHLFTVTGITPKAVHLQDAKTGRRFVQEGHALSHRIPMLRVRPDLGKQDDQDDQDNKRARGDLGSQQARRNRWVKEVLYERGDRLQPGA